MKDELTEIIRIDDPKIDIDRIARRILDNMRAHGIDKVVDFPVFEVVPVQYSENARFPAPVYFDLQQATLAYGQTWVQLQPAPSRFPLIGRVKHAFHQLVVFYVNRYAERQMHVNGASLRALNGLVRKLDESEAELAVLRQEVAALRAKQERTETRKGARSEGSVEQ